MDWQWYTPMTEPISTDIENRRRRVSSPDVYSVLAKKLRID